jgi:L-asparaginase II
MKYKDELMVNILRSGLLESQHYGSMVAVDFDGRILVKFGDPNRKTFIRSSAKPIQAIPSWADKDCVKHYKFTSPERAFMVASHSGDRRQQEIGRSILKKLGIRAEDLKCGIHPPFDKETLDDMRKKKEPFTQLCHNCSGNHMVMVALTKFKGWSFDDYNDPEHPYQQEVLKWVSLLSGVPKKKIGIGSDGCTAPVYHQTLYEMALTFARFSKSERLRELPNPDKLDIDNGARAMKQVISDYWAHPELIGGKNRLCTILNRMGKGRFFTKEGGESLHMLGIPNEGIGLALKIADGDPLWRSTNTAFIETLHQLNLISNREFEKIKKAKGHYKPDLSGMVGGRFQVVEPVLKIKKTMAWEKHFPVS